MIGRFVLTLLLARDAVFFGGIALAIVVQEAP